MALICDYTYMVGPCKGTTLTPKQGQVFDCHANSVCDTLSKLLGRELCMHQFQGVEMVCYEFILFAFLEQKALLFSLDY